jgi:hypothetical protein
MQASEAAHARLLLPGLGDVGDRVPVDDRRLDLRRSYGEWVLATGPTVLGHFGPYELDGRIALQALQQFHCNELCRIGASGFGFFLSHGRAPRGTTVGFTTRPLRAEALNVRPVDGAWAICENARPVVAFTDGDEARTALAAIKHFQFDAECVVGSGHLRNVHLFVKMR